MRAVAARVAEASVRVDGEVVGAITGPGLLVLLGVHRDDTAAAAPVMARKLHELRILDGERSCAELGAPLLVVSQFTLYGDTRKGRAPDLAGRGPARGWRRRWWTRSSPSCAAVAPRWRPGCSAPRWRWRR